MADLRVAVVVPTIKGREALLERTLAGWREHTPAELRLVVVRDEPAIGPAWWKGLGAALELSPAMDAYVLAADDAHPTDSGWLAACRVAARGGMLPSPRIVNPDGSLHSCGTLGHGMLLPDVPSYTPAGTSPFPFLTPLWAQLVHEHPGPLLDPGVHYYGDDWIAYMLRAVLELPCAVVREYELLHLDGQPADRIVRAAPRDRAAMLAWTARLHAERAA